MAKTILTGIQATGTAHIGNYFGAIKPAVEMAKDKENICYYFIADYHSLNSIKDPKLLKEYTYNIACAFLACGLDETDAVIYRQSDIPQVCELSTILTNQTPKGLLNRAHAYKGLSTQNIENGIDADNGINMGLFNYPILMTADICIMNAKYVPVGQDQNQHLEIARDIINNFNKCYKKSLVVPTAMISAETKQIVGTDGRKMSKSYNNTLPINIDEKSLQKIVSSLKTDSTPPNMPKPKNTPLYEYFELFATEKQLEKISESFDNGISYAEAKNILYTMINDYLNPIREKYNYYQNNRHIVDRILSEGAEKARVIASETISRVRKAMLID